MRRTCLPTSAPGLKRSATAHPLRCATSSGSCSISSAGSSLRRSAGCWARYSFPPMADQKPPAEISDLLQEDRTFPPAESFRAQAVVRDESVYERAERDPEAFWADFAKELEWFTPWSRVLEWKPPHAKWFVDGKLNASVNCVDRHARGARRNKAAIVWEGEPGDRRTLTYFDLYRQVSQFANVLKSLGVKRGDRVAIYLPLIPELAIAMLACARIGAIHSVVFGG